MSVSMSAEEQLERLRNQINWVTRISTALSSTKNPDDLISVILSGLLAPTGLGYSRVLYFEHDEANSLLHGKHAVFHESEESRQELARELEDEARFMEHLVAKSTHENLLLEEAHFYSLESSGPWIVLFQRLNLENEITRKIEKMTFSTSSPEGGPDSGTVFEEVPYWRKPRALSKSGLGERLPAALREILSEHFAMMPMFTMKGLRALLIVDRHLEGDKPIRENERNELAWFGRQAALAVENAEVNADLTKAYQELKQLDQMKSNFLSVISHELRTPLTAMAGFVNLLLEERVGEINENQRTLLARVDKNTGHLVHLVNDLIEVAEVEVEGAVEVRLEAVEPLACLMETLPKLEQRRRRKNVTIAPIVDDDLPRIQTDERSLSRIFFHLLDNAIKFSPEKSEVIVHFRAVDDVVHIDIVDQGVGIAKEHLKKIFTQFYQVDNTLTRGHEGLGLGLAVTKMLLQATHGRIDVKSEDGKGSTFTITYPIYRRREDTPSSSSTARLL